MPTPCGSGLQPIPCGNLIERDPPQCYAGHRVGEDCPGCRDYTPGLTEQERTRCEIWTRVMGYHRPVSAFNVGKQSEHAGRRLFVEGRSLQRDMEDALLNDVLPSIDRRV